MTTWLTRLSKKIRYVSESKNDLINFRKTIKAHARCGIEPLSPQSRSTQINHRAYCALEIQIYYQLMSVEVFSTAHRQRRIRIHFAVPLVATLAARCCNFISNYNNSKIVHKDLEQTNRNRNLCILFNSHIRIHIFSR